MKGRIGVDDPRQREWTEWRDSRLASVRAVPGNLALVAYQPVTASGEPVEGIDGATVRRAEERAGVLLAASSDLGVTVDGIPVAGEVFVGRTGPITPNFIRYGRIWMDVFSLDGSEYELRIYDEGADKLADFAGIEVYDFDPAAILAGRFEAFESIDQVAWEFTRAVDTGHTKKVPGVIVVEVDGAERRLSAFLDGETLVLVFADGTTGAESYAPGRFLAVPSPSSDGQVIVDFNRAFVPPCGFSDFYSCPVPPAQNRLDILVRAGEKRVLWSRPRLQ
jgi:uncharacterized protein (DUF1684 family)